METNLDYPKDHKLRQQDLEHTPADGSLYEVIDGELYVTPFPDEPHQSVIGALHLILGNHVAQHRLGRLYVSGLKVVLDEPTGVGPDLVFISNERMVHMRKDGFYGPPDLVVEVLSSRPKLDTFVKFEKYAQSGIPHYWIADPGARSLDLFRIDGRRYQRVAGYKEEGPVSTDLFAQLSFDVRELWR